ncbi:MAG: hypothetical protein Q4D56_12205 [Bacteroides sp.]|nr:hypothetical protein [Bacteroides sp.]
MKQNVEIKGMLMVGVWFALVIGYVNFLQASRYSTACIIAAVLLLMASVFWIWRNANNRQFARIMKKVGGKDFLYVARGVAAVEIDGFTLYYELKHNKSDWSQRGINHVTIYFFCALPTEGQPQEAFQEIKAELGASLDRAMEGICPIVYDCKPEYQQAYFSFGLKIHTKYATVRTLQKIQQCIVSAMMEKRQLHKVKRYFASSRNSYWEFVGFNAVRSVSYDPKTDKWCCDDKDVNFCLSDLNKNAVSMTEEEFEALYRKGGGLSENYFPS